MYYALLFTYYTIHHLIQPYNDVDMVRILLWWRLRKLQEEGGISGHP